MKREVILGRKLYEFTSLNQWEAHAIEWSDSCGVLPLERIAIDSIGRICPTANDMVRANKDGTFPVVVYCTDPENREV